MTLPKLHKCGEVGLSYIISLVFILCEPNLKLNYVFDHVIHWNVLKCLWHSLFSMETFTYLHFRICILKDKLYLTTMQLGVNGFIQKNCYCLMKYFQLSSQTKCIIQRVMFMTGQAINGFIQGNKSWRKHTLIVQAISCTFSTKPWKLLLLCNK